MIGNDIPEGRDLILAPAKSAPGLGPIIEAVARAWAGIDGKGDAFEACRKDPALEEVQGHFLGYLAEAEELLERSGLEDILTHALAACRIVDEAVKEGHSDKMDLILHLLGATDPAREALRKSGCA